MVPGQHRHERHHRRRNRRTDNRCQPREGEDNHERSVGRQSRRHHDEQQRACGIDREQNSLARVPVGQHAAERQRDRRRHHASEPEGAQSDCAGLLERVDGQRHEVRPLAQVEAGHESSSLRS